MTSLAERARALRNEVYALVIVVRDPRTPWHARAIGALTIGLAVSPIDPIPDFIPVLGYLDDLVFVPVGVYFVRRAVPDEAMDAARERASEDLDRGVAGWVVAGLVVLGWLVGIAVVAWVVRKSV